MLIVLNTNFKDLKVKIAESQKYSKIAQQFNEVFIKLASLSFTNVYQERLIIVDLSEKNLPTPLALSNTLVQKGLTDESLREIILIKPDTNFSLRNYANNLLNCLKKNFNINIPQIKVTSDLNSEKTIVLYREDRLCLFAIPPQTKVDYNDYEYLRKFEIQNTLEWLSDPQQSVFSSEIRDESVENTFQSFSYSF